MSFTIQGSRGIQHTSSCFGDFRISLVDTLNRKVNVAELTNLTALKVLKEIRFESSLLSLALSPVAIIILSASVPCILFGAIVITGVETALITLALLVAAVAFTLTIAHILDNTIGNDDLHKMSRAYENQAREAKDYVATLERQVTELTFRTEYKTGYYD